MSSLDVQPALAPLPAGIEFNTLLPVIGLSTFMFVLCMTWFGFSVQRGDVNRLFAPRSWARPKAVSVQPGDAVIGTLGVVGIPKQLTHLHFSKLDRLSKIKSANRIP